MSFELIYADGQKVPLAFGETVTLGRGDKFNITDKRCSRQQLEVNCSETGDVTIKALGVNPCFYYAGKSDAPKTLKRGQPQPIETGDSFTLLMEEYKFMLKSADQHHNQLKRKMSDAIQDKSSDENDVKSKKSSVNDENPSNLPECEYGSRCYRKNPKHFQDFYHPSNQLTSEPKHNEEEITSVKKASVIDDTKPQPNQKQFLENYGKDETYEEPLIQVDTSKKPQPDSSTATITTSSKQTKKIFQLSYESEEDAIGDSFYNKMMSKKAELANTKNVSTATTSSNNNNNNNAPKTQQYDKKVNVTQKPANIAIEPLKKLSNQINWEELLKIEEKDKSNSESKKRIAFPSLATWALKFDIEKASKTACEAISEFLKRYNDPEIRIIIVESNSRICELLQKYARSIEDERFAIEQSATITQLKTTGKTPCRYIVNECNWRLKGGGVGVNKDIFEMGGVHFESETKRRYPCPLVTGTVLPVPVDEHSLLNTREDVRWVLHCLPPNMNPMKPDYLNDDYGRGIPLLKQCYSIALDQFAKLSRCK